MTTGQPPDWGTLSAVLDGEIALPGSPIYEHVRTGFNARFDDRRPQAVVRCAGAPDVSETISFLERHRLEHVIRSGGHCFGGRSSTGGVVIDVSPMRSISASGGEVRVGAGVRLGDLYHALDAHGLTIPGGTCPTVGIAGLALGGGLGILGRTYGVTSDRLVAAQIVLADGRVLDCDADHHEDLFWALRGAGTGNFGAVTALTFRTVPAPELTNLHASWPAGEAVAVIDAWQRWAPNAPDELAASLKVTASNHADQPPSVDVYAALGGSEAAALELLEGMVAGAGVDPSSASHRRMSYPDTRRFWAELGVAEGTVVPTADPMLAPRSCLFAKSEYFRRPLPTEAIAALVRNFSEAAIGRGAGAGLHAVGRRLQPCSP